MYGRAGRSITNGSPANGPAATSSRSALSRTVRVTACAIDNGDAKNVYSGAAGTRPREGFSPTSPHIAAGMRIDPPPSVAWPAGTMPAATAAALPPEDPPAGRDRQYGLRVGPVNNRSELALRPGSGVLLSPRSTVPARRYRATISLSAVATSSRQSRDPLVVASPAT